MLLHREPWVNDDDQGRWWSVEIIWTQDIFWYGPGSRTFVSTFEPRIFPYSLIESLAQTRYNRFPLFKCVDIFAKKGDELRLYIIILKLCKII